MSICSINVKEANREHMDFHQLQLSFWGAIAVIAKECHDEQSFFAFQYDIQALQTDIVSLLAVKITHDQELYQRLKKQAEEAFQTILKTIDKIFDDYQEETLQ